MTLFWPVAVLVVGCCFSAVSDKEDADAGFVAASALFVASPDISADGDDDDLELHEPMIRNGCDAKRETKCAKSPANVSLTQRNVFYCRGKIICSLEVVMRRGVRWGQLFRPTPNIVSLDL